LAFLSFFQGFCILLNQMRIGRRLSLGFSIVIFLAGLLAAVGLYELHILGGSIDKVAGYNQTRGQLVSQLERATLERAIAARNLLFLTDANGRQAQLDQIAKTKGEVDQSLVELTALIQGNPGAQAYDVESLKAAQTLEARYWPVAQGIVKASNEGRQADAVASLLNDCVPLLAEVKQGLAVFTSNNQKEQGQMLASMRSDADMGVLLFWSLSFLTLVVGSALAWGITRSVVRPLQYASQALRELAQGNLNHPIHCQGRDEVNQMLADLQNMQASFRQVIGDVRSSADSISTASAEIASGNQDLSARTEQAASNLEETAASMEQLTSTVRQSADAARQANQLAASASEIAVRGGNVVGQVVITMDEINASSKKISDIIGVIDSIAFQTNILALNAAVEAARAGEQGRGFAVVASEVRSLAQRSAEAAKEIKGLIGSSVDRVEAGSRLVAQAGQTMSEIVGSVQRVSDIIGEITAAAGEQSDGIGQINVAVNQLDQMTQQNAALVEQSAAAAESLKDQAHRLAQVVQVFRISAVSAVPVAVRSLSAPAPRIATQPKKAPALAATSKPSPVVLKRPSLAGKTAPRPSPAPSSKPVAASGDDGDWESF
jgi:methyl-accepting chemotaxis protein